MNKNETTGKKVGRIIGRVMATIGTTLAAIFIALYSMLWIFCHGPSKSARNLFVSTILETGALKFLAGWYFDKDEILEITSKNNMKPNTDNVNTDLIDIPDKDDDKNQDDEEEGFDENGIKIVEISGRSYYGKLMMIKEPSKVSVATIYPWSDDNKSKYGVTLGELVTNAGAIAGINGGEYCSDGNWGGRPKGLVVSNGELQYNSPQWGDVMVGFNEDNILVIKDLNGMSVGQIEEMVKTERIRDCVSFKDIDDGDSNHFTKLIINGVATEINGSGSGANPRTCIGQRADGTVLMFVTDGRGASGHIGATAADLISVMKEYGAVNAANIDGGSSSSMYYKGDYEMTSVTLYYSTSSWKLPTGFVVK